jgi:hypothetical protein
MNIYQQVFTARCARNKRRVKYTLTIESHDTVMVEDIQRAVAKFETGYHEAFADRLFERFGGKQTLSAHHHGTDITTIRP